MKMYTNKSNAKRAAVAAGVDMATATLVEVDGKFAYQAVEPQAVVKEEPTWHELQCGRKDCPGCGIDLDNGLMDYGSLEAEHGAKAYDMQKLEWSCMGCGHEWGADCKPAAKGTGIKIQKDREERNGIVRPSQGGSCAAVWEKCDSLAVNGLVPAVKDIKAWAAEVGANNNNAVIEYYQWRKFMGVVGRAKEMPAQ